MNTKAWRILVGSLLALLLLFHGKLSAPPAGGITQTIGAAK